MPPTPQSIAIGTARAAPGSIRYGWFDAVDLPTGDKDRFPITIAQGQEDGPTLWLTTGIHGDEHTGVIVLQRLLTEAFTQQLRGTVIAVMTLSPAGLRTQHRQPYYLKSDPNRHFPDVTHNHRRSAALGRPEIELAYARLFAEIERTQPACLIDLHNAFIGSIPFVFRDPVFFFRRLRFGPGRSRADALALQTRTSALIDAFGFTVINEFMAGNYLKKNLHRSVSGSVLNGLGIPAFTVELGSWMHVDKGVVEPALAGVRNVLRKVGMLPGEPEPVEGIPVMRPGFGVRRHMGPPAPAAGIADLYARPGDKVRKGEVIGRMRDIFGRPTGDEEGRIRAEHDGFVIGWRHGVARYRGESLMAMAIRDDSELVVPYPE